MLTHPVAGYQQREQRAATGAVGEIDTRHLIDTWKGGS